MVVRTAQLSQGAGAAPFVATIESALPPGITARQVEYCFAENLSLSALLLPLGPRDHAFWVDAGGVRFRDGTGSESPTVFDATKGSSFGHSLEGGRLVVLLFSGGRYGALIYTPDRTTASESPIEDLYATAHAILVSSDR